MKQPTIKESGSLVCRETSITKKFWRCIRTEIPAASGDQEYPPRLPNFLIIYHQNFGSSDVTGRCQ